MSDHKHLTLDLVAAIDAGHAPVELIRAALSEPCPQCLELVATYLGQQTATSDTYRSLWTRVRQRFPAMVEAVHRETQQARRAFQEFFLRLPQAARALFAAADPRCSSRAFVEQLLDDARSNRRSEPGTSLMRAREALTVLDQQTAASLEQRIIAIALVANASRAEGDLQSAGEQFVRARGLANAYDEADAETLAELDRLEASLLIDLRHFEAAEALLARALETYQELGQVTLTAQTLIKLGHLFSTAHAPEAAIRPYRMALEIISEDTDPQLYLAARLNLTHALFELGRFIEARDLLAYDEDVYEHHADQHIAIRRTWLEGRIYRATGETDRAEALLLRTREVFTAQEHGFNAALVSLDLALLYHQLGRFEDLTETVATAVKLFSAYSLHREALAALVTLHDAAHQRAVSAESIERVATFLREIASDPGARSQPPS